MNNTDLSLEGARVIVAERTAEGLTVEQELAAGRTTGGAGNTVILTVSTPGE